MNVYIEKQDNNIDVKIDGKKNISGIELLKKLDINPATILLIRNNEVVLEDEIFEDKDDVKILSVISGG